MHVLDVLHFSKNLLKNNFINKQSKSIIVLKYIHIY